MQLEDEFGDIVAKARVGNGFSGTQLAAAVGLTEKDIGEIESYQLVPDAQTIARLAAALHLDPAKLAGIAAGQWTPRQASLSTDALLIRAIPVPFGAYAENEYVVGCARTHRAAVIDPGGAVAQIKGILGDERLSLDLILITHAHADHTAGLPDLVRGDANVVIVSSEVDRESVMRGLSATWQPARDGTELELGEVGIKALAAPGHTPGSTCYVVDGACFVGDTLFAGSIGRPASSSVYPTMLSAIRSKVLSLPGDTLLLPGHGPATTIAEELEHNPFFTE